MGLYTSANVSLKSILDSSACLSLEPKLGAGSTTQDPDDFACRPNLDTLEVCTLKTKSSTRMILYKSLKLFSCIIALQRLPNGKTCQNVKCLT